MSPELNAYPASQVDPEIHAFKRGIKRDPSQFTMFKHEKYWDSWNRETKATANAQNVENVLNPDFVPLPPNIGLFQEQQKYMYQVFVKNCQTDKGKEIVRAYESTFNAQAIYKELSTHCMKSTTAQLNSSELMTYITSVRIKSWLMERHN